MVKPSARGEFAFARWKRSATWGYSGLGGIEFGHLCARLLLPFQREQVVEDGHAFVEDGAARKRKAFLRQIADAGALHCDDGAGIEAVDAGQDLEQRGFAGAVGAHDAGAFVGGDQPVQIFEECFRAEAFRGPGELDHWNVRRGLNSIVRCSAS